MHNVILKPGRERSVLKHHPWIYSGAIDEVQGQPESGETIEVFSSNGEWLARAAYSPSSQIRARIWTWDQDEPVDAEFIRRRLQRALKVRQDLMMDPSTNAYREVYAESDGLPGLVVDRYDEIRVLQFMSAGAERWRKEIIDILKKEDGCEGGFERSDVDVRQLEALPLRSGLLWGREPDDLLTISEYGLNFYVDIPGGQKTGFYLDQRENRCAVRNLIRGGEILNCFCYTGGFSVAALAEGAKRITSIDSSAPALELAVKNVYLNQLPIERCEWIEGDVFVELRKMRDGGKSFDAIILDPPRFASTSSHAQRAARGYKDINLLAFKLLHPGGLLFTFSCSGGISVDLFQKIIAGAALDAGVEVTIIDWLGQPSDHPVLLSFPEGRYLKGFVCRVLP